MNKPGYQKNIRATALQGFWGDEYEESIYLWQGAKHKYPLSEIANHPVPTLDDSFARGVDMNEANDICKDLHIRLLPVIARKLNEIHGLDLEEQFWTTALGIWLFQHICITYDKYVHLQQLEIENTSITLLDTRSYYVPDNHTDYIHCFTTDFGVQQLVSEYYNLFAKRVFPEKQAHFEFSSPNIQDIQVKSSLVGRVYLSLRRKLSWVKRQIFPDRKLKTNEAHVEGCIPHEADIVLCGVHYSKTVYSELYSKSQGRIQSYIKPSVNARSDKSDFLKRNKFGEIKVSGDYEKYFFQTLVHCFPQKLIEHFAGYYAACKFDIQKWKFRYICSEDWISNIDSAIVLAVARTFNRTIIHNEHAASQVLFKKNAKWMEVPVADKRITVGWDAPAEAIVKGGFACREVVKYNKAPSKRDILLISHIRFPYLQTFSGHHQANSSYIKELMIVDEFMGLLNLSLKKNLVLRPRRLRYFWDTEYAWQVAEKGVTIDEGPFPDSIINARIVIIDHLSTGFAEILLSGVPCLILHEKELHPIADEYKLIIDELYMCNVFHDTAQSAANHLDSIYDNVYDWWNNEEVQKPVQKLISETLGPASQTSDYLLSLLN